MVLPLIAFAVYWGASITGLLREGMQAWVLTLVAVVALQQAAAGFPWLRSVPVRVVLALRAAEVFAVAVGATLGTRHFDPWSDTFRLNDVVATLLIALFSILLVATVWRESGRLGRTLPSRPAGD